MQGLLLGRLFQLLGRPSESRFLNRAHVQDPVMEVFQDGVIRGPAEKFLVDMDAVASKERLSWLWDMLFHIAQ